MTDLEKLLSLIEGKTCHRIKTPENPGPYMVVETWGNSKHDDGCIGAEWSFDDEGTLLRINFFGET